MGFVSQNKIIQNGHVQFLFFISVPTCFACIDQLNELVPSFLTIFFSEFFIDWIKHAFVLKFNNISAKVKYS